MPTLPAARYTQQLDSIFTTTNHSLHLDNSRGQQLAALVNQVTLVTVIGHVRHAYRHQMSVSVYGLVRCSTWAEMSGNVTCVRMVPVSEPVSSVSEERAEG